MSAGFLLDASHPLSLYQIAGWIAVVLFLFSYQVLNPRRTILLWIPADALFAFHFFGLGSLSTMCVSLGALVRDTAAVCAPRKIFLIVLVFYVLFVWVMIIGLAEAPYEYLAAVGTTFLSIATFYRDRFIPHRLCSYGHQICWLTLFLYLQSWPGLFQMVFVLGSNSLGLWRYLKAGQNR